MGSRIPSKINSLSSYIDAVFKLRKESFPQTSNASYWFFRGQSSSNWSMRPNIFRKDVLLDEFESIESALRQRPYDFRECGTDFEILTKLQHYGLGTRLLDVTLNPLVALYFATKPHEDIEYGKDGRGKRVKRDGKIVYKYSYGHKIDELNVRIGCALPFLRFDDHYTLEQLCCELKSKGVITEAEYISLSNNSYVEFIKAIQANSFVVFSYSNERLMSQSGAFIIPSAINITPEYNNIGNSLVRKAYCELDREFEGHCFIVPHDKKEEIRDELDFLNINEATLFPELEHQLTYLKNRKTIHYDSVEPLKMFVFEETKTQKQVQVQEAESNGIYYEPKPDVEKIVSEFIIDADVAKTIANNIKDALLLPDWWCRDSVLSQITRDITRILQDKLSVFNSKSIANGIVAALKETKTTNSIT